MKHFVLFLTAIAISPLINAQVTRAWVQRLANGANDYPAQMVADGSGNTYVTGTVNALNTTGDIVTRKYNGAGTLIWSVVYNSPYNNSDVAYAITRDASGNIYVTGAAFTAANYYTVTLKYNSSGVLQWSALFNPTGYIGSEGFAITTDAAGNVYVAGHSDPPGGYKDNYCTLKYNSSGVLQWSQFLNGTGDGMDQAKFIRVDNAGNVYICGESTGSIRRRVINRDGTISFITVSTQFDIVAVKYNAAGTQLWATRYNGTANNNDQPNGMLIDSIGNMFITGVARTSGGVGQMITMKYDAAGASVWTVLRPGVQFAVGSGLLRDASGNIIVTGTTSSGTDGEDLLVVKYNPSGTELWANTFNGGLNDEGTTITQDAGGNLYVAGSSIRESAPNARTSDIVTCKFSPSGALQWSALYNGPGNLSDMPVSIATYSDFIAATPASIYVAGSDNGGATAIDWVLIKYTQPSQICCVASRAAATLAASDDGLSFRIDNFPNPFKGATTLRYSLPESGRVAITVIDLTGRVVATFDEGNRSAGRYQKTFHASVLAKGLYQYKLVLKTPVAEFTQTKSMSVQ